MSASDFATSQPRTLVIGGGIGGNAVALQLLRAGIRATVVERAGAPRPGGQAVDLRGPSRDVAQRIGLMPGIRANQLDERGMVHVDGDGRELLRVPADAFGGRGGVAEIEISRGDLNRVLLDALAEAGGADYRYGEWVTAITQDDDGVDVTFSGGGTERFDIVVGADGLHSSTRRIIFGQQEDYSTYLGGYMSFFTLPTPEGLEPHWFTMHSIPGGTGFGLRPDRDPATCKAIIMLRLDADPALRHDVSAQQQLIRDRLAGAGWVAGTVVDAMAVTDDFYFDEIARIELPTWSKGRVVLLGDSGYCGSPLTGHGTAMALLGAYVLAGEIAANPTDPRTALNRYEQVLRPFVATAQELPPGGLKMMCPKSRLGIRTGQALNRWMMSKAMKPLMMKMLTKSEDYDLPDYSGQTVE